MTFRPSAPDGTLLYSDDSGSGDFLAINLVDRYVEFRFDCGSGGATIRLNAFTLFPVSFTSAEDIQEMAVDYVLQEHRADQHGHLA